MISPLQKSKNKFTPALKIDTSLSIGLSSGGPLPDKDMKELAEAFVKEEVERQKRSNGVTISKAEQEMMRKAFLAGMQHSPDDKDHITDLRWEFDQSESLDAMGFSFDDGEDLNIATSFDGLIEGHGINPHNISRRDPSILHGGLRTPNLHNMSNSFHHFSTDGQWAGIHTSDIIDADVNEMSLSMSMLNMSLEVEESQDHTGHETGGNFS